MHAYNKSRIFIDPFFIMQMTVTWTSGYALDEAFPLVEWGLKGETQIQSPAGTLRIDQSSMCGIVLFIYLWLPHNAYSHFQLQVDPFYALFSRKLLVMTEVLHYSFFFPN